MKVKDNTTKPAISEQVLKTPEISDRQSILAFVKETADVDAKEVFEKKLLREKEEFLLMNGSFTSIHDEREKQNNLLAEFPQNHEPKFTYFFPALGKLMGWTEAQMNAYHKPAIAAKTINECIYDRFTDDVKSHIYSKNPYIKWCLREFKHYRFLGDDGILMLEEYIDDTVTLMNESTSMYEFRMQHAAKFGTTFQHELFQ
jgi:hypothetical protein